MPEGPEVETIVRGLQQVVDGVVTSVDTSVMKGLLKNGNEEALQSRLLGSAIESVERFGKWVVFKLCLSELAAGSKPYGGPKGSVVSHLGMFGTWLVSFDKLAPLPPHTRLRVTLSTAQGPCFLTYVDMRSWGRLYSFTYPEALHFIRQRVGVDATTVTPTQLKYFLRNYTGSMAEMLLDQSLVAGIGNIYRAEILWHARIAPDRPGTDITEEESFSLWQAIRSTIARAITLRGSSIKDYRDTNGDRGEFHKFLQVYGREGQPCTWCNHIDDPSYDPSYTTVRSHFPLIVSTKRFDDRSMFYCPSCQK